MSSPPRIIWVFGIFRSRVGSTNLNIASWFGNCEMDVVVESGLLEFGGHGWKRIHTPIIKAGFTQPLFGPQLPFSALVV